MAQRNAAYPIFINCGGTITNAAAAAVMADTGAVNSGLTGIYSPSGGGIYEVTVNASSSVDATLTVQRRDAANANTVGSQPIIRVVAKGSVTVPYRFELLPGERVRVLNNTLLAGDSEVTINAQRVA